MEKKKRYKVVKIVKKTGKTLGFALIGIIFICRSAGFINTFTHRNIINKYNIVVSDFADYLKENDASNPKIAFDYFNKALWNGYLSNNHSLSYSLTRNLIDGYNGIGCIMGESVCLNNAEFLASIYRELGYNAFTVTCYIEDDVRIKPIGSNTNITRNVIQNEETERIEREQESQEFLTKLVGNHAITCVEYHGDYYFYDPTNLVYLGKSNISDLSVINGTGKFTIRYLSSSLLESALVLGTTFFQNGSEYSNYILNSAETAIDEETLETFYLNHESIYSSINDSYDTIDAIVDDHHVSYILSGGILAGATLLVDKALSRKKEHNGDRLDDR